MNRQTHGWLAGWLAGCLKVPRPAGFAPLPRTGLSALRRDGPGPVGSHTPSAPRELCNQEVGSQHPCLTRLSKQMACFPSLVKICRRQKSIIYTSRRERLKLSLWVQYFILLSRHRLLRTSNITVSFKMFPNVIIKILDDKELPNDFPILTSTNCLRYIWIIIP